MYLFFFAPISVHQIHVLTGFNASKKKKICFSKIWRWTPAHSILHQFDNRDSKGTLCVISGPSIVLMPRQLISKKCWKPLQGKGISQKSAHLINLTSALTVYTRTLRRPKKCTLFFQSPRFYIVVIVSQRRNLALICYGRKDIEDDFKRITKRFLNVKLKHIWHMRCSTLHRYFILHENLFFMNSICSKWFLLRSCTVVVFICFGVVLILVWMV